MADLFLSYRRDDSAGFAGRLADDLEAAFGAGSVFRDVDDIRPGEDFVHAIETHLRAVGVVLVMIGPSWLACGTQGARRLDNPHDYVRVEIEAALRSGKPLIPLLVGGADMPAEADLPGAMARLARRQAVVLSDAGWRGDVARLVASLRGMLPQDGARADARERGRAPAFRPLRLFSAGLAAIVVVAGLFVVFRSPSTPPGPAHPPVADQLAVDVTGRWAGRVKYDWGDQHDEVFEFKYLGNSLHGTATYLTGRLTIEQVSLEGDWLRFVTRSQEMLGADSPWKEVTHRYTGQVTSNTIHFTLETGGGYTIHPPLAFTVQRQVGE